MNSSRSRVGEPSSEMLQITKLIIERQNELNNYLTVASRQQILYTKINKLKRGLVESDSNIKTLLIYLKEAEQILSSAVYQSRLKLNAVKKAKPLPVDLVVRYAHKISSDYGVCCPENWVPDNPKRPYPTDAEMRRGWLMQVSNMAGELGKLDLAANPATNSSTNLQAGESPSSAEQKPDLIRSNSKCESNSISKLKNRYLTMFYCSDRANSASELRRL